MTTNIFRVVNFRNIEGITFFYDGGALHRVYCHDTEFSCAASALEMGSPHRSLAWIYVPMCAADPVRSMMICNEDSPPRLTMVVRVLVQCHFVLFFVLFFLMPA